MPLNSRQTDGAVAAPDRLIPLEGAQNFRDLGGYVAADGRQVRWRRVFRSAALQDLTPADADTLASLSLTDVFDLRTARELEHFGASPLGARGVRHHHVPFVSEIGRAESRAAAPVASPQARDAQARADGYLAMLERGGPAVTRIFTHLAARPEGAIVFHCTAGRDRTGMVAALLLAALGVGADTIAEDYALTERHLTFDAARAAELAAFYGMPQAPGAVPTDPDVMRLTLAGLTARHGSALATSPPPASRRTRSRRCARSCSRGNGRGVGTRGSELQLGHDTEMVRRPDPGVLRAMSGGTRACPGGRPSTMPQ